MRSEATIRMSSSISYISRTLPEAMSLRSESVSGVIGGDSNNGWVRSFHARCPAKRAAPKDAPNCAISRAPDLLHGALALGTGRNVLGFALRPWRGHFRLRRRVREGALLARPRQHHRARQE